MHLLISRVGFGTVSFEMVGLGFDSFLVCLAIGCCAWSWPERFQFAVAFGTCDAAATLLGSMWPHLLSPPLALLVYLPCVCLLAPAAQNRRVLLYALPLLCSVDNLFGGLPASTAPALGAGSATMAFLGLSLSGVGRRMLLAPKAEA
jgi:hypothetical protein